VVNYLYIARRVQRASNAVITIMTIIMPSMLPIIATSAPRAHHHRLRNYAARDGGCRGFEGCSANGTRGIKSRNKRVASDEEQTDAMLAMRSAPLARPSCLASFIGTDRRGHVLWQMRGALMRLVNWHQVTPLVAPRPLTGEATC